MQRLEAFDGIEFPKDSNTVDHLLKLVNKNKTETARKNAEDFREESYAKFKEERLVQDIRGKVGSKDNQIRNRCRRQMDTTLLHFLHSWSLS